MSPTARARTTDPATSHEAAERVREFDHNHWERIVAALREGPAIAEVIASRAGIEYHAVARRLPELEKAGRARPTGKTITARSWRRDYEPE